MMLKQEVIFEKPPLFHLIDAKFNVLGLPVIFSWGDKIYNPERVPLTDELYAHEAVHGERQGKDIEAWWMDYLNDIHFRLKEEEVAHQAEYAEFCKKYKDRNVRAKYLFFVSKRLSSPLYGNLITHPEAMKVVKNEPKKVRHRR